MKKSVLTLVVLLGMGGLAMSQTHTKQAKNKSVESVAETLRLRSTAKEEMQVKTLSERFKRICIGHHAAALEKPASAVSENPVYEEAVSVPATVAAAGDGTLPFVCRFDYA
ncbi:MAG: hypothetical protein K2O01_00275, partial [Bacteroidales bacterium]|nr:hypothetical protein [Bacteroidales bacterium]